MRQEELSSRGCGGFDFESHDLSFFPGEPRDLSSERI